jgi:hypothetical protein
MAIRCLEATSEVESLELSLFVAGAAFFEVQQLLGAPFFPEVE